MEEVVAELVKSDSLAGAQVGEISALNADLSKCVAKWAGIHYEVDMLSEANVNGQDVYTEAESETGTGGKTSVQFQKRVNSGLTSTP